MRQIDGTVGYVPNTFLGDTPISTFYQHMPDELVGMDDDGEEDDEVDEVDDGADSVSSSSGSARSDPASIKSVGSQGSESNNVSPGVAVRPKPMPRRTSSASDIDRAVIPPVPKHRSPLESRKDAAPPPTPTRVSDFDTMLPPPPLSVLGEDFGGSLPPPPPDLGHAAEVPLRDSTGLLMEETFVPPPPAFVPEGVVPPREPKTAARSFSAPTAQHTAAIASVAGSRGTSPQKNAFLDQLGTELTAKLTKRSIEGFSRVMSVRKSVKPPTGKRAPTVKARRRRVSAQASAEHNKLPPANMANHRAVKTAKQAPPTAVRTRPSPAPRQTSVGASSRPRSNSNAPPPPPTDY